MYSNNAIRTAKMAVRTTKMAMRTTKMAILIAKMPYVQPKCHIYSKNGQTYNASQQKRYILKRLGIVFRRVVIRTLVFKLKKNKIYQIL